ncbi:MAG: hypothetical protein ABSC29_01165 [Minisyncoccia bacterium]|jgi:hypothetical protein
MDRTLKGTIAVVISAFILFVAVYGSYMPMRKAQMFIGTLQSFQTQPPTSLQNLEDRLSIPLDYPSPIGQEELVRNTANSVLSLIQRGTDATTTAALINFLDGYYDPIIAQGKGMSFGQDVYLEGAVNEIAFVRTGDPSYLGRSLQYYRQGNALGPNRPQPLYGLFDVYRTIGDVTDTQAIAQKILTNWPMDQSIPGALAQFLATVKAVKK